MSRARIAQRAHLPQPLRNWRAPHRLVALTQMPCVVLAAAGQQVKQARPARPAQLTERELDVLRLIARGHSIKQMAQQLTISPKTVDTHIQHIYEKIGVSTRAGATLFAVEHNVLANAG